MLRLPVSSKMFPQRALARSKSSSNYIRESFIEYFVNKHGHKRVKSSSVVPLCDPTVPFVNAGMNQFKGVFLGRVDAPSPRVVNSQKCVRVGGKHNDLEAVGMDGHHHTFFEMLGNWSFGDYYKKEACRMAWDLLLGPYRLKPEELVVTYFGGDAALGLQEDRECRNIWREIGVPSSRLKALGAKENFWEMGATGPCGPCTEIHHVGADGTLTEIWNIVFIHCNREEDGKVSGLSRRHVDTGMGLERMAALLQRAPSNYDTDLFQPIIRAIEKNSGGVPAYGGRYGDGDGAALDGAYRRLADHARMVAVCLADGVFPAASLNLKQIMRKSFKMSTDVFRSPLLLTRLYDEVAATLGDAYPELVSKEKDAKLIMAYEEDAYAKLRSNLAKRWKDLAKQHPEVEALSDVEIPGFVQGYTELKETMSKLKSNIIPGELVFKMYDTHGFQEDLIERIAKLNSLDVDKKSFSQLLAQHKARHKTALKEQSSHQGYQFANCIQELTKSGLEYTNDQPKYACEVNADGLQFKPLKTKLVAILNQDIEWIDYLEPCESRSYYLVTEDTNFYCEEGGQISDTGVIRFNKDCVLKVDSVFKICDFVFHKGSFELGSRESVYVKCDSDVELEIDSERRLNIMKNHTAVHLLNAAVRKVLANSVVCQVGSRVTDKGLSLSLSVYGDKLSQELVLEAQDLVRKSIEADVAIETRVLDGVQLSEAPPALTVPGEAYPERGLRLVAAPAPLPSRELCCGTHVPSTGLVGELCVTAVRGAGGRAPTLLAIAGDAAKQARELFCHAEKLQQVIDLVDPERKRAEVAGIRARLAELVGAGGAPYGEYARCLALLGELEKTAPNKNEMALQAIAEEEVREAAAEAARCGRRFVVHFVRCSYLMPGEGLARALRASALKGPALLMGCAQGLIVAECRVPKDLVTQSFSAPRWLACVLPAFAADLLPTDAANEDTYAQMVPTKVSLITCEQQVQDAMRAAVEYARAHVTQAHDGESPTQDRRLN